MKSYKIIEELYVFTRVLTSNGEDNLFHNQDIIERVKYLAKQKPSSRKLREKSTGNEFYSSCLGNFIVSDLEKDLLKFQKDSDAEKKAVYFSSVVRDLSVYFSTSGHQIKYIMKNNRPGEFPRA